MLEIANFFDCIKPVQEIGLQLIFSIRNAHFFVGKLKKNNLFYQFGFQNIFCINVLLEKLELPVYFALFNERNLLPLAFKKSAKQYVENLPNRSSFR